MQEEVEGSVAEVLQKRVLEGQAEDEQRALPTRDSSAAGARK